MNPDIGIAQIEELQTELQHQILNLSLIFVTGVMWVVVVLGNMLFGVLPVYLLATWMIIQFIGIVVFWLRERCWRLAVITFLVSLWFCIAVDSVYSEVPVFVYLFSIISVLTNALVGQRAAVQATLASSSFTLVLVLGGVIPISIGLTAVLLIWVIHTADLIALQGLRQSLGMMHHYQSYIVQQMLESRESRAQLAQLTKALSEATENLEYANTQLRHARKAAEEARRLKAQFAANVSHELRTPINLIVGFADMMVNASASYDSPLPSAYWKDMMTVYRNGKHLQGLINDVLDLSQLEAGQMVMVRDEVNPGQILMEAAELVQDSIASKGIAFEVDVPTDLPSLWLDRVRIRQVILNLLGNAIRFTDQGQIRLQARVENDHLLIGVTDTGIGIPQSEINRVFEEFHQMESSLSRRYGGSGLGLTLSKQFVEMHGGRIWVESEGKPGKGSTFWLTLPQHEQTFRATPALRPILPSQRSHSRYFIVLDDDPAVLQLFERHSSRHHALGISSADEALHLLRQIQPSALVMDQHYIDQPDIKALVSSEIDVPIITCCMPSGRRAMQLHGVTDYLVKPVSQETLRNALRRLLTPVRNVLIIDDEHDIVRLYDHMLRSMSPEYQIRRAYGGLEGLAIMKRTPPDVVILDLLMPEMDGYEVIEAMKAQPGLCDIPIILASAYGASDAITSSAKGELSVMRGNGFQPIELVRCVESIVDVLKPASEPG